jgi:hypothetical protein
MKQSQSTLLCSLGKNSSELKVYVCTRMYLTLVSHPGNAKNKIHKQWCLTFWINGKDYDDQELVENVSVEMRSWFWNQRTASPFCSAFRSLHLNSFKTKRFVHTCFLCQPQIRWERKTSKTKLPEGGRNEEWQWTIVLPFCPTKKKVNSTVSTYKYALS